MVRKSRNRFSEKIMLKQKIERDDYSKKSHPGLGDAFEQTVRSFVKPDGMTP
jgi:hypothetical protein